MVDKTEFMVLDFTRAPFLDSSATRAIESLIGYADEANITVFASGIDGEASRALEVVSGIDQRFESRTEALAEAVRMMEQTKRPAAQARQA
jgi:anti-anti-sigma regulatory factor